MDDSWNEDNCDCLLYFEDEVGISAREMYVIKGDTWIIQTREDGFSLSLDQATFDYAKRLFEMRLAAGWIPRHMSVAWKSLVDYRKNA